MKLLNAEVVRIADTIVQSKRQLFASEPYRDGVYRAAIIGILAHISFESHEALKESLDTVFDKVHNEE